MAGLGLSRLLTRLCTPHMPRDARLTAAFVRGIAFGSIFPDNDLIPVSLVVFVTREEHWVELVRAGSLAVLFYMCRVGACGNRGGYSPVHT